MIKEKLLGGIKQSTTTITIFGDEYKVRRLTTSRLNAHDKALKASQQDADSERLNGAAALLVLDSMLDEDDSPLSSTVTPEQLMDVYSPSDINHAMSEIIRINFLGIDAEDVAKKN